MQPPERQKDAAPAADLSEATGKNLRKFAAIVALLLVAGFLLVHHLKSRSEDRLSDATEEASSALRRVDVITAKESPASVPLTLPGETAAWYESTIYARVDGYVGSWKADIGDHVHKGDVLAAIDTPELDAELAAARAKLRAAEAQVAARQASADFAKTTYERWKESPKGVVSEQEREEKKADFDNATAQLNEAGAQAGLDQADIDRYAALTQFKQVTAPYDGTITERHIDIGNLVTAGSNSGTAALYRIVQDDPIRVFADVPQNAASDIKTGLPVRVTAGSLHDKVFEGKVTRTSEALNPQARTLRVEVDIPNPDHSLVSGLYVNVAFQISTSGLVQVPAAALVFRTSGPEIAVAGADGKIAFHKVTIVHDSGESVDLGSGAAAGDRVALNISSQISEGDKVDAHDTTEGATNAPAKE